MFIHDKILMFLSSENYKKKTIKFNKGLFTCCKFYNLESNNQILHFSITLI